MSDGLGKGDYLCANCRVDVYVDPEGVLCKECQRGCPSCAALRGQLVEAKGKEKTGGDILYMALATKVFGRIIAASPDSKDADIELMVARIISERDAATEAREKAEGERDHLEELVDGNARAYEGAIQLLKQAEAARDEAQGALCAVRRTLMEIKDNCDCGEYEPCANCRRVDTALSTFAAPCPHAERVKALEEELQKYEAASDRLRRSSGGPHAG